MEDIKDLQTYRPTMKITIKRKSTEKEREGENMRKNGRFRRLTYIQI